MKSGRLKASLFEGEEPIPGTAVLLPSDKDNLCCVDEGAFRRCDIEKV